MNLKVFLLLGVRMGQLADQVKVEQPLRPPEGERVGAGLKEPGVLGRRDALDGP